MEYAGELEAALEAARQAGQAIMGEYAAFEKIADAPADITTHVDRQSQQVILRHLHGRFPGDALCAEEATAELAGVPSTGRRVWVVDPIDGTRGFARKNGEFSVMVAFLDAGQVAVGVVLEPAKDRLTYAVRGGGCWRQDRGGGPVRCSVTGTDSLPAATLVQSHSRNPAAPSAALTALGPARVVETYSAGVKLAMVARGEVDLYLNTYEAFHDWDVCAGHVLVTEARGKVTGLAGQDLRYGTPGAWQRDGLLASNSRLHDGAVAALRRLEG